MFPSSSRCRWLVAPGRWAVRARVERFVEPAVLLLLAEQPRHGYELKEQVRDVVGEDHADVANLYRMLHQLEVEGLVRSGWARAGLGPARRVYALTRSGRRVLDQWAAALAELSGAIDGLLDRHRASR